jgi:hypothetical protein
VLKICSSFVCGCARLSPIWIARSSLCAAFCTQHKSAKSPRFMGGLWAVRTEIRAIRVALGNLRNICNWCNAA